MRMFQLPVTVIFLLLINGVSLALFGVDKLKSIRKRCRIPETQLLLIALFGPFGVTTIGDPRGEGLFYREYTKQQPFIESLSGNPKVQRVSFSEGTQTSSIEFIESIPVNDFSYLKEIGLVP